MTRRLPALDPSAVSPEVRSAIETNEARLGIRSPLMRTMANSPAALTGYLGLDAALSHGNLEPSLRHQIALAVAEANACRECAQEHTAAGRSLGLDEATIRAARYGSSTDPKVEAALQFAQKVAEYRGEVTDEEFDRIRRAGYSDEDVAEIIANVVLSVYSNYFNIIAQATYP